MREELVRITTHDTEKMYEFPRKGSPALFLVEMRIRPVDRDGAVKNVPQYRHIDNGMYVELDTLLKAGMKPYERKPQEGDPEPVETAEDLMVRLLELVGVYPEP